MAENLGEGFNRKIGRRSLLRGVAKGIAVVELTMAAGGQTINSASADTPTPTPTSSPTGTPTPDANARKIAGLETAIARQKVVNAEGTTIAGLERTATAVSQPPETATPTASVAPTSTPDVSATVAARATMNDASARYRGSLQASATAEIANQTATVVAKTPTATPEKDAGEGFSMQSRDEDIRVTVPKPPKIPVGIAAAGGAAFLAGGAVVAAKKFPGFRALINTGLGAISRGRLKI